MVGDRLETHKIETKNGAIQIITLPWLTASNLMTKSDTEGKSMSQVNESLIEKLRIVLEAEIRKLNPEIPTVLLGHLMADRASLGAERFLAVGKGFNIPVSLLNRPCFDYVALGHVHKHQNLNKSNNPPIIYPGSIERVDFSEEKEEKGFVFIELEKGEAKWKFCSLPVRSFQTMKINVSEAENPQNELLKAISKYQIENAVVRLIYQLRSEQLDLIDNNVLHQALTEAHTYTIQPELVSQLARPRLPELSTGNSIDPLEALKTYLESREDIQDIQEEMLEAAGKLLAGKADLSEENSDAQLSLFSK